MMRVYGRVYSEDGTYTWTVVTTAPNGLNDWVYVTALVQELKLNLGESPFWGNRGIPAGPSVVTQVAPDYYSFRLQQLYAPYFMSLMITRIPGLDAQSRPTPNYKINITTHEGVPIELEVPV